MVKIIKVKVPVEHLQFEDVDESRFAFDALDESSIDIERLIFCIRDIKEVEVIVLKALGYKPKEITRALGYDNVGSYYQLNFRLKRNFEKLLADRDKDNSNKGYN